METALIPRELTLRSILDMSLPSPLSEARDLARRALAADPAGAVALSCRKRIWASFGPHDPADRSRIVGLPHFRRGILAILCARHVLPLWDRVWASQRPHQVLELAEGYLRHPSDDRSLRQLRGSFKTDLDNLLSAEEELPAVYAGIASARALTCALDDERFDEYGIDETIADEDLDPYEWDASFYASLASAGGAVWEAQSSPDQRRRFWKWYLDEALTEAWNSVEDS